MSEAIVLEVGERSEQVEPPNKLAREVILITSEKSN